MDIKKKYPGFLTVDDAMGLKKRGVYDLASIKIISKWKI